MYCCFLASRVPVTAMPMLPPRLRIRLNRLVAFPMRSSGIGSMLIVVSGTNSADSPSPWKNCGQKMSQYPAFRFSVPSQNSVKGR